MNLQKCERTGLGSLLLVIVEFIWANTTYPLNADWLYMLKEVNLTFLDLKVFSSVHSSWTFSGLIFPYIAGHKRDLVSDSEQLCLAYNRHPVKTHWMEFVAPIEIKPKGLFHWYFLDLWCFPHISSLFQCLIFPWWFPECSATEFISWLVPYRDQEATILKC